MEFITKFNVNAEIWFMHKNKACSDTVFSIHLDRYIDGSGDITYDTKNFYSGFRLSFREKENKIFHTKEDLLKSL